MSSVVAGEMRERMTRAVEEVQRKEIADSLSQFIEVLAQFKRRM
jgi:hypothetical protein